MIDVLADDLNDNHYYCGMQYKITIKGQKIDIGDGGFVNWTQQLLQNKKERLLTGGIGIELLHRLL